MTVDGIVSEYIHEYRDDARAEMRFFEVQRSPSAAIQKAALCALPSGKRHPHQRRVPRAVLELAEARLQTAAGRIAAASDFSALHDIVEREIGSIRGIGALTVYDIAHRLKLLSLTGGVSADLTPVMSGAVSMASVVLGR